MSKGDDGGPGIFEMLQELRIGMRKDMDEMKDELMKRIQELEDLTKMTDNKQQEEIDDMKLLADNQIALSEKMQVEINNLKLYKVEQEVFDQECLDIRDIISKMATGQPVEIKAPSPKGPKITQEDIERWNGLSEKTLKLEDLLSKLDGEVDQVRTYQREIQAKLTTFALQESLDKTNHDLRNLQEDTVLNT